MSTQKPDIVERLRDGVYGLNRIELCKEAADEIERLRNFDKLYIADVYHAGTDSFYKAVLITKISKEDIDSEIY